MTGSRARVVEVFVGPFGIPELLILLVVLLLPAYFIVGFMAGAKKRARRFGYASAGAYLHAAPKSDAERRDAADMAIKGLVTALLGMFFAPIVLIGLVPLFYGGRKLAYAALGLGLVDDAEQPRA